MNNEPGIGLHSSTLSDFTLLVKYKNNSVWNGDVSCDSYIKKYEYFFKSHKYPKYELAETYYYDDNFNLIKKNNSNINAKENKE